MSRVIYTHPVERLVIAYLKRFSKTSKLGRSLQIIDKAAKLIGTALHDPCCPPAEEVTLGITQDFFLIQITSLLNGIDERKWKESLERAKALLEQKLNKTCCFAQVQGFGGNTAELMCVGLSSTYIISTEEIQIGTIFYQNYQLTPVTFTIFREDATGVNWTLENGVVTGASEDTCFNFFRISNSNVGNGTIDSVTVNDVVLTHNVFDIFPLTTGQFGDFRTDDGSQGFKTVKVFISGTTFTATLVTVTDSNALVINQAFIGPGVYTFNNVYLSGPNPTTFNAMVVLQ